MAVGKYVPADVLRWRFSRGDALIYIQEPEILHSTPRIRISAFDLPLLYVSIYSGIIQLLSNGRNRADNRQPKLVEGKFASESIVKSRKPAPIMTPH